mmetsp:Transcript_5710/g.17223  ORF Transcript_5710/g.17223 Transcript_5710/m.17223 type:complete len:291 (-) Transcript_5710:522-1394(-)|eukprot:CAMPEP_0197387998 /NCGR_PEP_ID=MMETSP1165-20131217/829_1 /TAXON_ID=284809 /ORGANISM="Chrysocystis fragilis, Strain CCMP3189" /LENGTH=290 /DNA_ID=CAMNT_0042913333 /DNA_START=20 /DNA_END=892 /DNA_ORIENTATION=+
MALGALGFAVVVGCGVAFQAGVVQEARLRRSRLNAECREEFSISREIKSVRVFEGDYADAICEAVEAVGSAAIADKGSFSLAIPGGSVVKALGGLSETAMDFGKMHVFFCNERIGENKCYKGALDSFATAKGVPAENVHGVGSGDARSVAQEYESLLKTHHSIDNDGALPSFDMMLLGTGEDGHCGSIYPNSPEVRETGLGRIVFPIEGKEAIALSIDVMSASKVVLVSAAGAGRAPMVAKALSGEFGDFDCPAGLVDAKEETLWYVDEDSVSQFDEMQDDDEFEDDDDD